MLYTLLYTSEAAETFDEATLTNLLDRCRVNNAALEITGLLVYHNRRFIQVLEGTAEVVQALYAKIQLDARHQNVAVYYESSIPKRAFGQWQMAFRPTQSLSPPQQAAVSSFLEQDTATTPGATKAQHFLVLLRDLLDY